MATDNDEHQDTSAVQDPVAKETTEAVAPAAESPSQDGPSHGDHGLAHTTPVRLLLGVFGALIVLTVLTVAVTSVDLGSSGNLAVAMTIATIKALLVAVFFMHLKWDNPFNRLALMSSVLFLALFLSIALLDRSEYQSSIDELRDVKGALR